MIKLVFISLFLGLFSALEVTDMTLKISDAGGDASAIQNREVFFFIVFTILFFFLGKFIFLGRDKYCTWCGSRKLKYLDGETGEWIWKYRNKHGSPDKRVSDNYQQAGFKSKWQCKKCGAISQYVHYIDKKPSKEKKVWKGILVSDGKGERSKTDYNRSKDGEGVNSKSAHRKGDG